MKHKPTESDPNPIVWVSPPVDTPACSACGSRPRLGALKVCKQCLQARGDDTRTARADAEQRAREKLAAEQKATGKVKACRCCGETKPLASFPTWPTAKDGHRHDCRGCIESGKAKRKGNGKKSAAALNEQRAQNREKAKALHRRVANRRHVANWQARNPEAVKAKNELDKAVKRGQVSKPSRCQVRGCRDKGRLNGHHPDYRYPLVVVWTCSAHHKQIHAGHFLDIIGGLPPALLGIPTTLNPKTPSPREVLTDAYQSKTRQTRPQARHPRRHRSAVPPAAE